MAHDVTIKASRQRPNDPAMALVNLVLLQTLRHLVNGEVPEVY
jgi:hypothetical protein